MFKHLQHYQHRTNVATGAPPPHSRHFQPAPPPGYYPSARSSVQAALQGMEEQRFHYGQRLLEHHSIAASNGPEENGNGNGGKSSGSGGNINLKTYLESWNEEDVLGASAEGMKGGGGPGGKGTELYVYDSTDISNEAIGQYLHIQQVDKLPENIRGYFPTPEESPSQVSLADADVSESPKEPLIAVPTENEIIASPTNKTVIKENVYVVSPSCAKSEQPKDYSTTGANSKSEHVKKKVEKTPNVASPIRSPLRLEVEDVLIKEVPSFSKDAKHEIIRTEEDVTKEEEVTVKQEEVDNVKKHESELPKSVEELIKETPIAEEEDEEERTSPPKENTKDVECVKQTKEDVEALEMSKEDVGALEMRKEDVEVLEMSKEDVGTLEMRKEDVGTLEMRKEDVATLEMRKEDGGTLAVRKEVVNSIETRKENVNEIECGKKVDEEYKKNEENAITVENAKEEGDETVEQSTDSISTGLRTKGNVEPVVESAIEDSEAVAEAKEDCKAVEEAKENTETLQKQQESIETSKQMQEKCETVESAVRSDVETVEHNKEDAGTVADLSTGSAELIADNVEREINEETVADEETPTPAPISAPPPPPPPLAIEKVQINNREALKINQSNIMLQIGDDMCLEIDVNSDGEKVITVKTCQGSWQLSELSATPTAVTTSQPSAVEEADDAVLVVMESSTTDCTVAQDLVNIQDWVCEEEVVSQTDGTTEPSATTEMIQENKIESSEMKTITTTTKKKKNAQAANKRRLRFRNIAAGGSLKRKMALEQSKKRKEEEAAALEQLNERKEALEQLKKRKQLKMQRLKRRKQANKEHLTMPQLKKQRISVVEQLNDEKKGSKNILEQISMPQLKIRRLTVEQLNESKERKDIALELSKKRKSQSIKSKEVSEQSAVQEQETRKLLKKQNKAEAPSSVQQIALELLSARKEKAETIEPLNNQQKTLETSEPLNTQKETSSEQLSEPNETLEPLRGLKEVVESPSARQIISKSSEQNEEVPLEQSKKKRQHPKKQRQLRTDRDEPRMPRLKRQVSLDTRESAAVANNNDETVNRNVLANVDDSETDVNVKLSPELSPSVYLLRLDEIIELNAMDLMIGNKLKEIEEIEMKSLKGVSLPIWKRAEDDGERSTRDLNSEKCLSGEKKLSQEEKDAEATSTATTREQEEDEEEDVNVAISKRRLSLEEYNYRKRLKPPTDFDGGAVCLTNDLLDVKSAVLSRKRSITETIPLVLPPPVRVSAAPTVTGVENLRQLQETRDIVRRFLNKEYLSRSELLKVREIIKFKSLLTKKDGGVVSGETATPQAQALVQVEATLPSLPPLKLRKKRRFRNLYSDDDEDDAVVSTLGVKDVQETAAPMPETALTRDPRLRYGKRNCGEILGATGHLQFSSERLPNNHLQHMQFHLKNHLHQEQQQHQKKEVPTIIIKKNGSAYSSSVKP